jgi:hypothetical protein
MLTPLGLGLIQFRNPKTDQPVRNGTVSVTDPVTGLPVQTFADQAGQVPHADNPVPLNDNGEQFFYADQPVSMQVFDCCGAIITTYSPVGFSPIALKSGGVIESTAGVDVELRYGDGVTENSNVFCYSTDEVDFQVLVDDTANDQFPDFSQIRLIRANGFNPAGSGFAITATGSQKVNVVDGYLPSCGIVDLTAQECILLKTGNNAWFLFGDLD